MPKRTEVKSSGHPTGRGLHDRHRALGQRRGDHADQEHRRDRPRDGDAAQPEPLGRTLLIRT
jgi:hypothetical protein